MAGNRVWMAVAISAVTGASVWGQAVVPVGDEVAYWTSDPGPVVGEPVLNWSNDPSLVYGYCPYVSAGGQSTAVCDIRDADTAHRHDGTVLASEGDSCWAPTADLVGSLPEGYTGTCYVSCGPCGGNGIRLCFEYHAPAVLPLETDDEHWVDEVLITIRNNVSPLSREDSACMLQLFFVSASEDPGPNPGYPGPL